MAQTFADKSWNILGPSQEISIEPCRLFAVAVALESWNDLYLKESRVYQNFSLFENTCTFHFETILSMLFISIPIIDRKRIPECHHFRSISAWEGSQATEVQEPFARRHDHQCSRAACRT